MGPVALVENTHYVTEAYLDGIAGQVPSLNLAEWEKEGPELPLFVK